MPRRRFAITRPAGVVRARTCHCSARSGSGPDSRGSLTGLYPWRWIALSAANLHTLLSISRYPTPALFPYTSVPVCWEYRRPACLWCETGGRCLCAQPHLAAFASFAKPFVHKRFRRFPARYMAGSGRVCLGAPDGIAWRANGKASAIGVSSE